ncbi:MAG: hypothetical protein ACI8ZN_000227 [Bacteroidia bacterium]|jgi:hypothetical protein
MLGCLRAVPIVIRLDLLKKILTEVSAITLAEKEPFVLVKKE